MPDKPQATPTRQVPGAGVATITAIRLTGQPLGFVFAFANCALFMLYIVLGHRIANAVPGTPASTG